MMKKRILLVEPPDIIRNALQALLKFFHVEIIVTDLNSIPNRLKQQNGLLKPVLACSPESWKYLRWVNIWQEIMENSLHDVDLSQDRLFNQHIVVPAIVIPNPDIIDIIASKKFPFGNFLPAVISNFQTPENNEILVKAARKKIAAHERHEICSKIHDWHDQHDILSALRLIQGAFLAGTVGAAEGEKSYKSVCREIDCLPTSSFFYPSRDEKLDSPPPTPLSSILLIDDKHYWASALEPIFKRLGIKIIYNPGDPITSITGIQSDIPVRAIILDLKFPQGKWHGAALLSDLDRMKQAKNPCPWLKKRLPIILQSVEDTFSKGAFLKKAGAFAFISKNPNEGEPGNRDEIMAFMQLKDLIIFAQLASLSNDLEDWWGKIIEADGNQILGDPDFSKYASNAFDSLYEECRRIFHGKWQDYDFPVYLGTQQVIRAFGKLNDKWCELCTNKGLDPDPAPDPKTKKRVDWSGDWEKKKWPHQSYHYILTNIRNAASHAMVEDEKFHFPDAWIAVLAFMLKLDGLHVPGENTERTAIDAVINKIIHSLSHLLFLIKVIPDDLYGIFLSVRDENFGVKRDEITKEITEEIQCIYKKWKGKRQTSETGHGEQVAKLDIHDSSLIIGMDPYFLHFREEALLCFEAPEKGKEDEYEKRTFAQKLGDLFLSILILCRMRKAKSEMPGF
jgi:hypothetical protein